MWGILLTRRRIVVEGLQEGRSALKLCERGIAWGGLMGLGWKEKERDHGWMCTIVRI